jgi:hypothetical protein
MNIFRKISFCLVIIFPWRMDVFANSGASSDNPYAQIVTRNVFALATSVSSASSTLSEPLPTITPSGIMSVFGSVQTLFKVTDSQPGQPASEKSYILGEGQREDDIEVVRIDEKNAIVTFNNHGTIQELPLVAATAPRNVGQTASSSPDALRGNRFAGGTALASGNQMTSNNGNITDSSESGSGYAGGAHKNNPQGQGLMVPNVSFAGASDSDNASLQTPAVSNDVGSDNNNVSGQADHISAAERLADIQMVLFARQHMQ